MNEARTSRSWFAFGHCRLGQSGVHEAGCVDSVVTTEHAHWRESAGGIMKLYRIDKLSKLGGIILKKKHVLAASDKDAVQIAAQSADCPVCDVLKDGQSVGSIV